MDAFELGHWLYEEYAPYIEAYWDAPKSLEELQADALNPSKGYDIHHIVEKAPARRGGFPEELINGPENLVRISRLKHWELTAWSMTPNPEYGWLTPRQYADQMPNWDERTRLGINALRRRGLLRDD